MAEKWDFPESLIVGIGEHHDIDNDAVPLSIKIATLMRRVPGSDLSESLTASAAEAFALDYDELFPLIDKAIHQSAELSEALS